MSDYRFFRLSDAANAFEQLNTLPDIPEKGYDGEHRVSRTIELIHGGRALATSVVELAFLTNDGAIDYLARLSKRANALHSTVQAPNAEFFVHITCKITAPSS